MKFSSAGGSPAIPKNLEALAVVSGYNILFGCIPSRNIKDVDEAEFRALFVDVTDRFTPSQDLSALVHNGTTQLVITGLTANDFGTQYRFLSANPGRWYFAWRLHNSEGWSLWSDGTDDASQVSDYIDTEIDSTEDTGAPAGFSVTLVAGAQPNTWIPKVTRPTTNGRIIRSIEYQIADGDSVTWRALDANAGAASTNYDGSAISHTLSNGGLRVTRDAGAGFGTAQVGDLACLDVTGAGFNIGDCQNRIITAFEGGNAATATWFEVDTPFEPQSLLTLNLQIVTPPWMWGPADGYLGQEANRGYYPDINLGGGNVKGDLDTQVFYGPAMEVPAAVTNPEVRVFIENGYSVSDNAVTHSSGQSPGVAVDPPQDYTDFSDQNHWLPFNTAYGYAEAIINANKTVTLNGTHAPTPQGYAGMAGVCSRDIFLPDQNDGEMILSCSFDSWVIPTDFTNTGRDFLFGMMLMSHGWMSNWRPFIGVGYLGTYAAPNHGWESVLYSMDTQTNPGSVVRSAAGAIPAGASFTVQVTCGVRLLGAGTTYSWGVTNITVTGAGGFAATWNLNNPGGDTTTSAWGGLSAIMGYKVALGLIPRYGSAIGSARLTGFSLIKGVAINNAAGVEIAQASPIAPGASKKGLKIFRIWAA